ncbi:hypothetical protein [Saccharothrix luteola]|uniref:hypothetical protein n=1 Tax=Saccharothrix luteola TaxID=2893018 RepID=UPI001E6410B5|nr:hypothetical protein [Saccharothrix luteola]MCC8244780.1 hypothetical protein [Saccharothrix luteola]
MLDPRPLISPEETGNALMVGDDLADLVHAGISSKSAGARRVHVVRLDGGPKHAT